MAPFSPQLFWPWGRGAPSSHIFPRHYVPDSVLLITPVASGDVCRQVVPPFRKHLWSRACHHTQTSTISATLLHPGGLLLAS